MISSWESLWNPYLEEGKPIEAGFASVLSIEPLLVLLHENGIRIDVNPNILDDMLNGEPS